MDGEKSCKYVLMQMILNMDLHLLKLNGLLIYFLFCLFSLELCFLWDSLQVFSSQNSKNILKN